MSRYKLTALPGTLWPNPLDEWADELEIRLRHDERTTKSDALMAAGMIAAYRELVRCPAAKREAVVRGLKEADAEQRTLTASASLPPPSVSQDPPGGG